MDPKLIQLNYPRETKSKQIAIYDRCKSKFKPSRLNFLLKCVLLFQLAHLVYGEPAWFQVCDPKQKHALNSVDCRLGLWLNHSITVDCVCLNGVWVLSTGLCDEDAIILVGSGDCFNVDKKIRSVKLIGNPDNPFAATSYVISQHFDSFVRIWDSDYNPTVGSVETYVLSINPQGGGIQRSDQGVCLVTKENERYRPVHFWKNERRVSDKFKFVSEDRCRSPKSYDFHVGFGEVFQASAIVADITTQDCASQCQNKPMGPKDTKQKSAKGRYADLPMGRYADNPILGENGKRMKPTLNMSTVSKLTSLLMNRRSRTKIRWDAIYSIQNKIKFVPDFSKILQTLYDVNPDKDTPDTETKVDDGSADNRMSVRRRGHEKSKTVPTADDKDRITLIRKAMSMPAISHARETREQSVRMIQSHTNSLLLNQPAAKINTHEYDYFQRARQIFLGVAPPDLIPPKIVNGLTRMFRLLLWESHDKFAHQESTNPVLHDRIVHSLDTCLLNTSVLPMYFVKGPPKKTVSTHGCPDLTVRLMWNASDWSPENDRRIVSTTMPPPHLRFNVTDLDASVELAWKIFMFTFYHCGDYFESSAGDHSEMAEKIQSLFNYKVLKRWYESEDFNLALQVVFPGLDLNLLGFVVDRLVGAAREGSMWRTWLARPVLPITQPDIPHLNRKKRSTRYRKKPAPPPPPPTTTTEAPSRRRKKQNHMGRSLLVGRQFYFNYWRNKATCLESFTDPVELFGYESKTNCHVNRIEDE